MKTIDQMTDQEILALTEEQINRLIDYDCASEGVPLLPPCPTMPAQVQPEPDGIAYSINGFSYYFKDIEDAGKVLKVLSECTVFASEYCPGGDYKNQFLKPLKGDDYSAPKMEKKVFFTVEGWDAVKSEMQAYQQAKKEYDADFKIYKEAADGRSKIATAIWNAIRDARDRELSRENAKTDFARYLDLAEGNATIAMNFLLKAKPTLQEDSPELIQELCPGYGSVGPFASPDAA